MSLFSQICLLTQKASIFLNLLTSQNHSLDCMRHPSLSVVWLGNVSAAARQKKDFHSSSASPGASRYLLPPPQLIFTLLHSTRQAARCRGKDKLSCSSYLDLADCRVILKVTPPASIPFPAHLNCYSLWRRPPGAPPGPLLGHKF